MSWLDNAKCKDDPNPDRWFSEDEAGLRRHLLDLQDICALCPVRNGCGKAAMEEEAKSPASGRHGFRAYMTPAQRDAIHRNGGLRGRDPQQVVMGMTRGSRRLPRIPEEGIEWKRTHVALAKKLGAYMKENVKVGHNLPKNTVLCEMLSCGEDRLQTVLDAMLHSGIIIEHDNQLVRTT